MRATWSAALVLTTSLAAGRALAAAPPEEAESGPVRAVDPDPNVDRGFILPTAMTQPSGSLTYNNYELLLHGVTYAVNDSVQATLTVLPPIVKDIPLVLAAAIKGRLSPVKGVHLALQGSLGFIHAGSVESDDGGTGGVAVYSLGAGGYASVCLSEDCASLLNAGVNYQYAANFDGDGSAHLLVYGGSVLGRLGRHVKLLAEITSAATRERFGSFSNIPGFLLSYGLRLGGTSLAADVGFIRPVDTSSNTSNDFVLGLPFVNVSYRWN